MYHNNNYWLFFTEFEVDCYNTPTHTKHLYICTYTPYAVKKKKKIKTNII